MLINADGT